MTPEGSVILGSRHTTVYIVNAASGSLIHAFMEVDGRPVTFGGHAGALACLLQHLVCLVVCKKRMAVCMPGTDRLHHVLMSRPTLLWLPGLHRG